MLRRGRCVGRSFARAALARRKFRRRWTPTKDRRCDCSSPAGIGCGVIIAAADDVEVVVDHPERGEVDWHLTGFAAVPEHHEAWRATLD